MADNAALGPEDGKSPAHSGRGWVLRPRILRHFVEAARGDGVKGTTSRGGTTEKLRLLAARARRSRVRLGLLSSLAALVVVVAAGAWLWSESEPPFTGEKASSSRTADRPPSELVRL